MRLTSPSTTCLTEAASAGDQSLDLLWRNASAERTLRILRRIRMFISPAVWLRLYTMAAWWLMISRTKVRIAEEKSALILNMEPTSQSMLATSCTSLPCSSSTTTSQTRRKHAPSTGSTSRSFLRYISARAGTSPGTTREIRCHLLLSTTRWLKIKLLASHAWPVVWSLSWRTRLRKQRLVLSASWICLVQLSRSWTMS